MSKICRQAPFLLVLLFILIGPVKSQWYQRQYDVDQVEQLYLQQYQEAFRKSDQLRKFGLYTIGGSLAFAALGSAVGYAIFEHEVRTQPDNFFPGLAGIGIMYSAIFTSAITLIIGIPPWMVGRSRLKQLEQTFPELTLSLQIVPIGFGQSTSMNRVVSPTLCITFR